MSNRPEDKYNVNQFPGPAASGGAKVLVVEDELEIRRLIGLHLQREGCQVVEAESGEEACQILSTVAVHLIIIDWMLPGMSGLELTGWIRRTQALARVPILFVTAKVKPEDIATGLHAGADDYITKPFDALILRARVQALLRRHEWLQKEKESGPFEEIGMGPVLLRITSHEAFLDGKPLELTRSEFRLLETLMRNQGKVLSRDQLVREVQGGGVNVVGRTVDTHIFGLRKKLESHSRLIETIRGVGYRTGPTGDEQ